MENILFDPQLFQSVFAGVDPQMVQSLCASHNVLTRILSLQLEKSQRPRTIGPDAETSQQQHQQSSSHDINRDAETSHQQQSSSHNMIQDTEQTSRNINRDIHTSHQQQASSYTVKRDADILQQSSSHNINRNVETTHQPLVNVDRDTTNSPADPMKVEEMLMDLANQIEKREPKPKTKTTPIPMSATMSMLYNMAQMRQRVSTPGMMLSFLPPSDIHICISSLYRTRNSKGRSSLLFCGTTSFEIVPCRTTKTHIELASHVRYDDSRLPHLSGHKILFKNTTIS